MRLTGRINFLAENVTILHVLTGTIFDGTVTYTNTLADRQIEQGHRVIIIAKNQLGETRADFASIPINKRGILQRLRNIELIKRVVKSESADLIHAHSRAASWLCHFVAKLTKTPYVSTIHAFIGTHASVRNHNIYGERTFAICEKIKEHAIKHTKYFNENNIEVIHNGIEF